MLYLVKTIKTTIVKRREKGTDGSRTNTRENSKGIGTSNTVRKWMYTLG
jgi:hypothetical protein